MKYTLNEARLILRELEKKEGYHKVIYKVYDPIENGNLIYIGMGGSGSRPGSGRLYEHHSRHLTNFRSDYCYWYPIKHKLKLYSWEMEERWSNLKWEFTPYNQDVDIEQIEQKLILEHRPKYNKEGL